MTADGSSPISSLVPIYNPPKAVTLALADGTLVPVLPPAKPVPVATPSNSIEIPTPHTQPCFYWEIAYRPGTRVTLVSSGFEAQLMSVLLLAFLPTCVSRTGWIV